MRRQHLREPRRDGIGADGGVVDADERTEYVAPCIGGDDGGHRGCDARHPGQRCLDLPEFDAIPADLDPVVGASDELQGAVGQVPDEIARPVPGAAAVLDELLGGEVRSSAVPPRDAASREPQLSGHPVRAVLALGVDDPAGVVRERHAVRHQRPVRGQIALEVLTDLEDGAVDGGLRGAAETREPHLW